MPFSSFAIEGSQQPASQAEQPATAEKPTFSREELAEISFDPDAGQLDADTGDGADLDTDTDELRDDGEDAEDRTDAGEDIDPEDIQPLGPGEDASEEELADWRREHGVPETADAYQPPQIEGTNWNAEAIGPIAQIAHKHNIPAAAFQEALEAYASQVQAQQDERDHRDAQQLSEVKRQLTPAERTAIEAAGSAMSKDLRNAIAKARLPSGERLLLNQEFLHLLANFNKRADPNKAAPTKVQQAQSDETRIAEIQQVLRTDHERYFREKLDREYTALLNRREGR